jgi:hypothetical protein
MKVVFDTNVYVAETLGGDTATRLFYFHRSSFVAHLCQPVYRR